MQSVMQMFVARFASRNLSISRILVLPKRPNGHVAGTTAVLQIPFSLSLRLRRLACRRTAATKPMRVEAQGRVPRVLFAMPVDSGVTTGTAAPTNSIMSGPSLSATHTLPEPSMAIPKG